MIQKKSLTKQITHGIYALVILTSVLMLHSCSSSSTTPGTTSTVTAQNDIQNQTISGIIGKAPSPTDGPTVDNLTITRVRVLIKDLHLHVSDNAASGVGSFSNQPMILTFTPGVTNTIGTTTVPIGVYTQMIFDLHALDPVADASLVTNSAFVDFVGVGGPYTVIIEGNITNGGTTTPFTYKTAMVRNLKPVFLPSSLITVAEQSYNVTLRFDGKIAFAITSGKALDPNASENRSTLDDQIAKAFLAQH